MSSQTTLDVMSVDSLPLDGLPFVIDDFSVALRLGFAPRTMWWLLLNQSAAYKKFTIPKASGKARQIHAPTPPMSILLNNLRHRFLLPLVSELDNHVTAYRIGRGAKDAAARHIHTCVECDKYDQPHTCEVTYEAAGDAYRVVKALNECLACRQPPAHEGCTRRGVKVHLDLKDFFSNTRALWVREYLMDVAGYNYRAADVLAQLMTTPLTVMRGTRPVTVRGVPQGAPTSGDICNLVADHRLDRRMLAALDGTGWVYSRYADDIYLSHPENLDRDKVSALLETAKNCINEAGWRLNFKKVSIQRPKYQQRLLGVSLNRKPNIPDADYRRLRTAIHRCWKYGFESEAPYYKRTPGQLRSWLTGKLSWFSSINPAKAERLKLVLNAAKEKHVDN